MVNVTCVVCGKEFEAQKTTKKYQTICHVITNKSSTSYPFSYSYCKRPQRESINIFCEFNIKICDSNMFSLDICDFDINICGFNTIVTCNSYKNNRLYLLQK